MRKFLCPTPSAHCSGSEAKIGPSGISNHKAHTTSDEVIACRGRYLMKQGYIRKSRREYIDPQTGAIEVLSKSPGLPLRRGKNDEGNGKRTTPMRPGQSIGILG